MAAGFALEQRYREHPNIAVDHSPKSRKYVREGGVVLGFAHRVGGRDAPKEADLPMLMMEEVPKAWLAHMHTREWVCGHYHSKKQRVYTAADTHKGTIVRYVESLSGTDKWHYDCGFIGAPKRAEALVYDPQRGFAASVASYQE